VLAAARTSGGTTTSTAVALGAPGLRAAGLGRPTQHAPWRTPAPPPAAAAPGRRAGRSGSATFVGALAFLLGVAGLVAAGCVYVRRRQRRTMAADGGGGSLPFKAAPGDLYITRVAALGAAGGGARPTRRRSRRHLRASILPPSSPTDPLVVDFAPAAAARRRARYAPASAALGGATAFVFDVFLSYRRLDGRLVDAVQDKLLLEPAARLQGSANGHMAGRPFDVELFRVIRDSAVFAPVITLEGMRRLALLRPDQADFTLARVHHGAVLSSQAWRHPAGVPVWRWAAKKRQRAGQG
jgi:hypothetical protein